MIADGTAGGEATLDLGGANRVLVIDDDRDVRRIIRLMLEDEGYEVLEAADADSGLSVCGQVPCDVVLTDLAMPGRDGLSLIPELRRSFPEVKVIAMSGGGPGRLVSARQAGAHATLDKPISVLGLAVTLRRALRLPAWRQPAAETVEFREPAYA